jgi:hypothetical protein
MKAIERQHADFAVHVRGMTDQAIRLTIPYGVLENAPRMDDAALARMRDLNRGKMSAPAAASPTTAAILEPQPEPDPPITPKKW